VLSQGVGKFLPAFNGKSVAAEEARFAFARPMFWIRSRRCWPVSRDAFALPAFAGNCGRPRSLATAEWQGNYPLSIFRCMHFEYDPARSHSNKAKHGIGFDEAGFMAGY